MWFNPIVKWLLRSPLHRPVSKYMLLITYTGRKSGQVHTIPVNYVRAGDALLTVSFRDRIWWRNLSGGAPVTLRLQSRDVKAMAEVVEDTEAVVENFLVMLGIAPQYARYLQVKFSPSGEPDIDAVRRAAQKRVMIRSRLA